MSLASFPRAKAATAPKVHDIWYTISHDVRNPYLDVGGEGSVAGSETVNNTGGEAGSATVNNTGGTASSESGIYIGADPQVGKPPVEIKVKPCAGHANCPNDGAWSCDSVGGPYCGDCCKGCSRHNGVVSNIPRKERAMRRRGGVKVRAKAARK